MLIKAGRCSPSVLGGRRGGGGGGRGCSWRWGPGVTGVPPARWHPPDAAEVHGVQDDGRGAEIVQFLGDGGWVSHAGSAGGGPGQMAGPQPGFGDRG